MTANELTLHIADALNLTSQEAKARIGRSLNVCYRRVTSAIGLIPTRREEVSAQTIIGNRFVEFPDIEKIDVVFYVLSNKNRILTELTHDEMLRNSMRTAWPPRQYSIFSTKPVAVTIMLDCEPDIVTTIYAHGVADATTLTNEDSPAFPESFHDVLIHGVMADEYRKMEKQAYAKDAEVTYERRLSDLKMFIAKSAYLDIYGGKHSVRDGWWDTGPRR